MTTLVFDNYAALCDIREKLEHRQIKYKEYHPWCMETQDHSHASIYYTVIAIIVAMGAIAGAIVLQYNTMVNSFPMHYGNKALIEPANMIPVVFEITIFSIVFSLLLTFLFRKKARGIARTNSYTLEVVANKEQTEELNQLIQANHD